jgi:LysM repeat protein
MNGLTQMMMALGVISFFVTGCGGGGVSENHSNRGLNPGVGPFDSRGNYVESWADDRSKGVAWRPDRVVGASRKVAKTKAKTPKTKIPAPVVASQITPQPRSRTTASLSKARPPVVGSRTPPSKPHVTSRAHTTSAPKSKPSTAKKVKPKHKSPIRYTIKKGDTLYALSRKYKTSVSSIQRANGLKGTTLRIGRTLLIPRY